MLLPPAFFKAKNIVMITIQIFYLIICLSEAYLEQAVIYLKNPNLLNYRSWNEKEHARSLAYAAAVGLTIAIIPALYGQIGTTFILLPCLFFIRRIGFDFALKIFRGRNKSIIEGDAWFDKVARQIYGEKGGWIDVAVCVAIVGIINWLAQ